MSKQNIDFSPITALTHLDGRNAHKVASLRPYFSEFAWMKMRLRIIISYCKTIAEKVNKRKLSLHDTQALDAMYSTFSIPDAQEIISIEKTIHHDLKALEVYVTRSLKRSDLVRLNPFINLGIGSEDINSIAIVLLLKKSREEVLMPSLQKIIKDFIVLASSEKNTVMIARTHAQPANVTTFGKEVANSLSRLCDEVDIFNNSSFTAKCAGEVGSYQAFLGLDPGVDWLQFTDSFIRSFGLEPTHAATQIAPYDNIIRFLHSLYRINAILLDFVKNMWLYVLLGYLRVKVVEKEVGSAGMPHKVNPIYFEGAEGGLEMANGIIEVLIRKLPVNRLQRDFSDSTMRRNIVLPLAYSLLSYQSIVVALARIDVNRDAIDRDVQNHAEVWTETVKAYGMIHGISDMYDRLKRMTRGRVLTTPDLGEIITSLPLQESEKNELIGLCDGRKNPYPERIVEETVNRANRL